MTTKREEGGGGRGGLVGSKGKKLQTSPGDTGFFSTIPMPMQYFQILHNYNTIQYNAIQYIILQYHTIRAK